jgi:hypothetical protein
MENNIVLLHAQILEEQGNVSFWNGDFYEINKTLDGDYMVDVFEISDDGLLMDEPDARLMRPIDGGVCTGTAVDAVCFMSTWGAEPC